MLRYRLLGPLAVDRDGEEVVLGPPQQRAVLAVLAQAAGTPVSVDRIVHSVWGEDHPASVQAGLQAHISRLRGLLRTGSVPSPIARRGGGYVLAVDAGATDVAEFSDLAAQCSAAVERADWPEAVRAGSAALVLWRGDYLADLRDEEWVRVAAAPLEQRRAGVAQDLVTAHLGVGEVSTALAQAIELAQGRPLDERAAWLHAVALHRAGRTPDALDVIRTVSARLDEELGLLPGPALRDLHTALLRQDPVLHSWPVLATVATRAPFAAAAAPPQPRRDTVPAPGAALVGRDRELTVVADALAAAGVPWVVLTGPAGIGKTRLADEAAARWLRRTEGTVVRAQCPDLDERPPWWVVRQILRGFGLNPADLLSAASADGADAASFALLDRAAEVVRSRVTSRPALLVIDDLHWIDAPSARFLAVLAEIGAGPGPLVLVTTRPRPDSGVERLMDVIARRPGGRQLALTPLTTPDVARLIESVSGEQPTREQAADLAERSGGNPFVVVEFARQPPEHRFGAATPDAVRSALRRRFAGLPPHVHRILQAAAVLGDPVDSGLLATVAGTDEDTVSDALDAGADAELLTASPDGYRYVFAHALLRDELRDEVPGGRRRRMHAAAAGALGGHGLNPALRRAGHVRSAGPDVDPDAALAAFRDAAQWAEREWLPDAAATWWAEAADTVPRTGSDPRTADATRDAMVIARCRALARAGRGPELLETLDSALVDALRAGRPASAGRLAATLLRVSGSWPWPIYGAGAAPLMSTLQALEPTLSDHLAAQARVLAVTAIGLCYHPDQGVPDSMSSRAIELAEASGDANALADAMLGRALAFSGVASRAEESVRLLTRLARLEHENAVTDRVLYDNILTMAQFDLGRLDRVTAHLRSAVLGADVHRATLSRVQLRWCEAAVELWHGNLARAGELYAVADHAHRRTDLQQAGTVELAALALAWERGQVAEAPTAVATNPLVSRWFSVIVAAARGAADADDRLRAEVVYPEPDVWTSHGRLTMLGHAVADRGLVALAPVLLDALRPLTRYVAAFGQCGAVGPVALAAARLARLSGDVAARDLLGQAQLIAERSAGAGALLHCRVEAAIWAWEDAADSTSPIRQAATTQLDELAREADDSGRPGLAARARSVR